MKKILYVVPVLVIVLLGFKLKVRAANDYKYYLHEDGYVYWMPDYTDFSTNNGLFTFQEFYECANSEGLGQYSYDVSAHFSSGDVKRVEIYQDGGWYPLDSYEISHNDWLIEFNANDDDTIYTIISNDFEFWYQVDGDPLVETSLAGIRFYLAENVGQVTFDGSEDWIQQVGLTTVDTLFLYTKLSNVINPVLMLLNGYPFDGFPYYTDLDTRNVEGFRVNLAMDAFQIRISKERANNLSSFKQYLSQNPLTVIYEIAGPERQDLIYNFNLMNYPDGGALYDPSAYSSYNISSQYLSVRFKSIDLEKILLMNNGVMPEIIFKVNGVENNFYPYDEFKLTMPIDKKIRDRTFLFHINELYNKDLYMAFNYKYPEYLNEYHQYMLDKAEVDIRKLQVTIIFKDVIVDDEASIEELIQQSYNRGYSDGLTIGYEDAFNAGYDEGKRIGDILQYQYGYDAGYEEGLITGNEDAFNAGYDAGFTDGSQEGEAYDAGYADGANDSFLGSIDKWLVPAIIIVMLLGGFFAIARKKRDGDI